MEPLTVETFQPSLKEDKGPLDQRGEVSLPRPAAHLSMTVQPLLWLLYLPACWELELVFHFSYCLKLARCDVWRPRVLS